MGGPQKVATATCEKSDRTTTRTATRRNKISNI